MPGKSVILIPSVSPPSAVELEANHVHKVYEDIAPHFSSTRYKPWPVVSSFLSSLPAGSVGLDSGTGNGKYLPLPVDRSGDVCTIGLDRSMNLLKFAKCAGGKEREVVVGDAMECCWRPGAFDYALSIATIHHFSTPDRRKRAVQAILRSLSPSVGRALIYVWAIEQDALSKRSIPTQSSPAPESSNNDTRLQASTSKVKDGQGEGRDVFVPWILTSQALLSSSPSHRESATVDESPVFNRYYHMFEGGELRSLVHDAAAEMGITENAWTGSENVGTGSRFIDFIQDGWERSNYFVEIRLWTG